MKIKNAIIIHGPGRSGTTLLNNILSMHDDLGWISNLVNKYPKYLSLTLLNRLQDYSFFEKYSREKRGFPRPTEAYNFWQHYFPNFNKKDYKLNHQDSNKTQQTINTIVKLSGKKRFVFKITGESRHKTIDELFDNPYIIWIDRNPKSVIMSYYKQRWGYKNNPTLFNSKPTKELLKEYCNKFKLFQKEKEQLKKFNIKMVFYEDLVENENLFFQEICEFCKLNFTDDFKKIVKSWKIHKETNTTYKKHLTEEEEDYLAILIANK